ncbi:MAG: type II secretion system inner membrane protein GspF [Thiomonas sp.]|uniref:type II secretion system inner membrane protein GspF n=1 Tax=Thiomonas sp. TaxID=2047785 RepID=UPI002A36CFFC|nr:type II secretion system inner membrane protein GspF [Thiomonas sp.]MDY0330414.1 type II secretion system inner membrane protein GspF [Thiomonas sp.]
MPAYRFVALDAAGAEQSGVLESDSARGARTLLRSRGLIPLQVEGIHEEAAQASGRRFARRVFNNQERTLFTRQLAGLLVSGLPVEKALAALAEDADRAEIGNLLSNLKSEVSAGHSLGDALAQYPREFKPIYRALVSAGEDSGDLGLVMERLSDYLEDQQALRGKLVQAFAYPAIVVLVAVTVVVLLLTYVVPQVVGVFQGAHQKLPLLTVGLIAVSDFMRAWGWLILTLLVIGGIAFAQAMKLPGPRLAFDAMLLRSPLFGRLIRGINTARFASTLGILGAAGVPILRALQAAADTLSNSLLKADAEEAIALVREGASLSASLALHKRFPPVLITFIRLGEQTGTLPQMLDRAAVQHAQEVQRRALTLTTLLEPLLILVMGGMVLLIVLAVMMPIIQMNNLVK